MGWTNEFLPPKPSTVLHFSFFRFYPKESTIRNTFFLVSNNKQIFISKISNPTSVSKNLEEKYDLFPRSLPFIKYLTSRLAIL